MMSTVTPGTKTTEFARLFDLFDRMAASHSRLATKDTNTVNENVSELDVPEDFAPIMRNLTALLVTRRCDRRETATPFARKRRNTLAVSSASNAAISKEEDDESEDDEDVATPTFPLDQRFPFTFRLMLHKLYGLEEWADKVKNAVEASKAQFKPLAEGARRGGLPDADKAPCHARHVTRARSQSVLTSKSIKNYPPPINRPRYKNHLDDQGSCRVLKKRCVGRRKSVYGPMVGGEWVYDAAIASVESRKPRQHIERRFVPATNVSNANENELRPRRQSFGGLENIQARDEERKRVNFVMLNTCAEQHGSTSTSRWDPPSKNSKSRFVEDVVMKRRPSNLADETAPSTTLKTKRPLLS